MNEGMYSNQTFDSEGFHNDVNQHLSNMAPVASFREDAICPLYHIRSFIAVLI